MLKCVIFDFDGTLADTNAGIVATFKKTVGMLGLECPSDEAISATIGLPLKQNFLVAVPGISDEKADECVSTYRSIFYETGVSEITLFPYVADTLRLLRTMGLQSVVATSRGHRSLSLISDNLGISGLLDGCCCAEDVEHHKPAPDLVELILSNRSLDRSEVMVVGDTTYDLMMGQAAGVKVCGVTWGNHSREVLSACAPDFIIDSMTELPGICSDSMK